MLWVQVRVMPQCWFVLLRFWLRVDRVLVRLYETRLMGSLNQAPGAPLVSREVRQSQGTFEQLRSAGAPPAGVSVSLLRIVMHEVERYALFSAPCLPAPHVPQSRQEAFTIQRGLSYILRPAHCQRNSSGNLHQRLPAICCLITGLC